MSLLANNKCQRTKEIMQNLRSLNLKLWCKCISPTAWGHIPCEPQWWKVGQLLTIIDHYKPTVVVFPVIHKYSVFIINHFMPKFLTKKKTLGIEFSRGWWKWEQHLILLWIIIYMCVCVCVESVKNVWETHLCMTLCKLYNNYYTYVLIDIEDL